MANPDVVTAPIERAVDGYGRERQLGPYLQLAAAYSIVAGAGVASGLRRRGMPRLTLADGALLAVAAFKLSRIVTKAKVTGFVRAPFTRFVEHGDGAEVNEEARGEGLQEAVGELLTCPFCFTQWSATALAIGWLHAPDATRGLAAILAIATGADVLHVAWTRYEALA